MSDLITVPIAAASSNVALVSFLLYLIGVVVLAWLSSKYQSASSFVSEYFLGGRNLGVWALALTFAATSASGGEFRRLSGQNLFAWLGTSALDCRIHADATCGDGADGEASKPIRPN